MYGFGFSKGKEKAGDDLWMSRYILQQMSEDYGFKIEFHPKPVQGDWNGSGLHCNFSNKKMRDEGGEVVKDLLSWVGSFDASGT